MDFFDKVTMLKGLIRSSAHSDSEAAKQLDVALVMIKSAEGGSTFSDSDREFIDNTINNAEGLLKVDTVAAVNSVVCTGQIPRELYNEDLPGAISYDRVSQVPVFQVRGKSYMDDGKKVST
jgi:hypothetical protein